MTSPPTYGLDQLREDIERDYAPFRFALPGQEPAVFLPLLRLPKNDREQVFALIEVVAGDEIPDADGRASIDSDRIPVLLDAFGKLFHLLAQGNSGERFFAALAACDPPLDDDPAALLTVWEQYSAVAMPGEALPSDDSSTGTPPPSPGISPEPVTPSGTSSQTSSATDPG